MTQFISALIDAAAARAEPGTPAQRATGNAHEKTPVTRDEIDRLFANELGR